MRGLLWLRLPEALKYVCLSEPECLRLVCGEGEDAVLPSSLLFSRGWSDFSKVRGGLWQSKACLVALASSEQAAQLLSPWICQPGVSWLQSLFSACSTDAAAKLAVPVEGGIALRFHWQGAALHAWFCLPCSWLWGGQCGGGWGSMLPGGVGKSATLKWCRQLPWLVKVSPRSLAPGELSIPSVAASANGWAKCL